MIFLFFVLLSKYNFNYFILEYLGYVLDELGVKLNDTTRQIMNLLRLQNDEYTMKASSIASSKVVAVIAKIRNIK